MPRDIFHFGSPLIFLLKTTNHGNFNYTHLDIFHRLFLIVIMVNNGGFNQTSLEILDLLISFRSPCPPECVYHPDHHPVLCLIHHMLFLPLEVYLITFLMHHQKMV